ncbi:MAG: hypothetical protein GY778_19960 [bacterium]|nr:hypothetical protein [bacterium]
MPERAALLDDDVLGRRIFGWPDLGRTVLAAGLVVRPLRDAVGRFDEPAERPPRRDLLDEPADDGRDDDRDDPRGLALEPRFRCVLLEDRGRVSFRVGRDCFDLPEEVCREPCRDRRLEGGSAMAAAPIQAATARKMPTRANARGLRAVSMTASFDRSVSPGALGLSLTRVANHISSIVPSS